MSEDLESLSRSDLNARAADLGVEGAEGMRSKAAVIEAIRTAGGATDAPAPAAPSEAPAPAEGGRKLSPLEARRLRMRRGGR